MKKLFANSLRVSADSVSVLTDWDPAGKRPGSLSGNLVLMGGLK